MYKHLKGGESAYYTDCYVVFIDKLGTKWSIRENDSIYANRIGFYELFLLYEIVASTFNEIFNGKYLLFGFSDTVLSIMSKSSRLYVAKASVKALINLIEANLPVRIYISRGNFAYHSFESSEFDVSKTEGLVCPIYGSALLNAYEMDTLGIKSCGVFLHDSVMKDFSYKRNIISNKTGNPVGLIDFNKYSTPADHIRLNKALDENIDNLTVEQIENNFLNSCGKDCLRAFEKAGMNYETLLETAREGFKRTATVAQKTFPYYNALRESIKNNQDIVKIDHQ